MKPRIFPVINPMYVSDSDDDHDYDLRPRKRVCYAEVNGV